MFNMLTIHNYVPIGALQQEQQWLHALSFACKNENANKGDDILFCSTVQYTYFITFIMYDLIL